jgi:hypothetical protein
MAPKNDKNYKKRCQKHTTKKILKYHEASRGEINDNYEADDSLSDDSDSDKRRPININNIHPSLRAGSQGQLFQYAHLVDSRSSDASTNSSSGWRIIDYQTYKDLQSKVAENDEESTRANDSCANCCTIS